VHKNTAGWLRRYSLKAVVPHFGAPIIKKFGFFVGVRWLLKSDRMFIAKFIIIVENIFCA